MNVLYTAGVGAYNGALRLVAPFHRKARAIVRGRRDTLGRLRSALQSGRSYVWVHAASLGEFEQGRPLIERLHRERPDLGVVLSFFSPSGYEVRRDYDGADAVVYLPADTPRRVEEFLDALRPVAAVFVKYEFWGNMLAGLRRRGVPTFLISAIFRPGQIFFRPWGGAFRSMLGCFDRIFTQDEPSLRLLESVGYTSAERAGDTRFDRVADILSRPADVPAAERFAAGQGLTLIVGSSWEADEEVYLPWVNAHPDVRVIIAPHEFDAARLERLRARVEGRAVLLSEAEAGKADPAGAKCLIVDCYGRLSSIYRYAQIAYIGGGFGHGIHNVIEAAVFGMPVLFGPRHTKFREALGLLEAGAAQTFADAAAFAAAMDGLMQPGAAARAGEAAAAYTRSNLGATSAIWRALAPLLPRP